MRPCEHDRTVLSHPSTVPSPPDEARRLQPDTELLNVPVARLQVWLHLRHGAHRRIDRRVALQRGAEFCELLAEVAQRTAGLALEVEVLRVPPQGSQHRVRQGLRRQTRPAVRALQRQQVVQRPRGFERNLRVLASRAFFAYRLFNLIFKAKIWSSINLRRRHMIAVWLLLICSLKSSSSAFQLEESKVGMALIDGGMVEATVWSALNSLHRQRGKDWPKSNFIRKTSFRKPLHAPCTVSACPDPLIHCESQDPVSSKFSSTSTSKAYETTENT